MTYATFFMAASATSGLWSGGTRNQITKWVEFHDGDNTYIQSLAIDHFTSYKSEGFANNVNQSFLCSKIVMPTSQSLYKHYLAVAIIEFLHTAEFWNGGSSDYFVQRFHAPRVLICKFVPGFGIH